MSEAVYSLSISPRGEDWKTFDRHDCVYLKQVVYCARPMNPEVQSMNIFVPKEYITSTGGVNAQGRRGAFTALTAPIILSNTIAAYAEGKPRMIGDHGCEEAGEYVEAGMIYVSCGARGKESQIGETYIGKAPAGLVDLKAGVRFLKHNAGNLPGDVNRIISLGVSAGGAMSSLLGVTGNGKEFLPWLEAIGAAMDVGDDVYASQCYCPITNLEHADAAYEWSFMGNYKTEDFMKGPMELTPFEQALSDQLGARFPAYFNSLGLKHPETGKPLTLDGQGQSGSGYDYLMELLEASAKKHLALIAASSPKVSVSVSLSDYLNGRYKRYRKTPKGPMEFPGQDKSRWLSGSGNGVSITSLADMQNGYWERMKGCTAFDRLEMDGRNENQLFGNETVSAVHFSEDVKEAVAALSPSFPQEADRYGQLYASVGADERVEALKKLMNPMNYAAGKADTDVAPHFRIRVGSVDAHTSFLISMMLTLELKKNSKTDVDYAIAWDADHGACDYPGEFVDWVRKITAL